MNPLLPVRHFVPDAEARIWKDGRIWLYGSYDLSGDTTYCSREYHAFSSPDLLKWRDHGVCFRSEGGRFLYAPDCIERDGLYHLYYCTSDDGEGVAVSSSPAGPFTDPRPVVGADGDGIDPAVFTDDDGAAYYYWGQFKARGGRLADDMRTLVPESVTRNLLTEAEHGFHEGSSVRKRKGIYYFVYTDIRRGKASCLSYATSTSPLGPFVKGGVIIDNDGCDRGTWNNHGSIAEFGGRWYVFYHRSSQAGRFSRRVCAEPIEFDGNGAIREVEMTTQGVSGPIDARGAVEAWRACLLNGSVRTEPVDGSECLSVIEDKDWAAYTRLDFGRGVKAFRARAASLGRGGEIELRLDAPDGELIGTCRVGETGGWHEWRLFTCATREVRGTHALYLVFRGSMGRLLSLLDFSFR
jgi:arabinoxylan arabinofuranohydrolase